MEGLDVPWQESRNCNKHYAKHENKISNMEFIGKEKFVKQVIDTFHLSNELMVCQKLNDDMSFDLKSAIPIALSKISRISFVKNPKKNRLEEISHVSQIISSDETWVDFQEPVWYHELLEKGLIEGYKEYFRN